MLLFLVGNVFFSNIIYLISSDSSFIGCFPTGPDRFDIFDNGLTLNMIHTISNTIGITQYMTSNGFYFFSYERMTIEFCISICQKNGFKYAGLETDASGLFYFFKAILAHRQYVH